MSQMELFWIPNMVLPPLPLQEFFTTCFSWSKSHKSHSNRVCGGSTARLLTIWKSDLAFYMLLLRSKDDRFSAIRRPRLQKIYATKSAGATAEDHSTRLFIKSTIIFRWSEPRIIIERLMNSNQNTLIQNRSYFWVERRPRSEHHLFLLHLYSATKILMNLIFDIDFWKQKIVQRLMPKHTWNMSSIDFCNMRHLKELK